MVVGLAVAVLALFRALGLQVRPSSSPSRPRLLFSAAQCHSCWACSRRRAFSPKRGPARHERLRGAGLPRKPCQASFYGTMTGSDPKRAPEALGMPPSSSTATRAARRRGFWAQNFPLAASFRMSMDVGETPLRRRYSFGVWSRADTQQQEEPCRVLLPV
jgi:hypothetical protein